MLKSFNRVWNDGWALAGRLTAAAVPQPFYNMLYVVGYAVLKTWDVMWQPNDGCRY